MARIKAMTRQGVRMVIFVNISVFYINDQFLNLLKCLFIRSKGYLLVLKVRHKKHGHKTIEKDNSRVPCFYLL